MALSSCQDDTADNANEALENQVNHDYLNFERFSELFPKYAKRVTNKNKKSKEDASRGVYDSINDFTILTDKIFMAENEGGTYVTFGVLKASQNAEGLDNLVLKLDINGGFTPILVHYDLSEEEKTLLITEDRFPDLANKLTYKFLDAVDFNFSASAAKELCVTFMVGYCEFGNHEHGMENGKKCPGYKEKESTTCSGGSGGGGGGSSGGGNPGTGTYNPNGPSIPVITTPLPGEEVEVQIVAPCVKLKEKASNLVFNNKVAQLKSPNVYALDHEKGFVETLSPYKKSIYTNVEGTSMSRTIRVPSSMNAIGIVHVHNNDYVNQQGKLVNTIKILSPEDVSSLITFQSNAIAQGISYSDAYVEMLSSEGHFVIRLLSPVNSDVLTEQQWKNFNDEYYKNSIKMMENGNFNSENLQKMLLAFLKKNGLYDKVALYKATNDEVTQWSRLMLDPANPTNSPIKTPCN